MDKPSSTDALAGARTDAQSRPLRHVHDPAKCPLCIAAERKRRQLSLPLGAK